MNNIFEHYLLGEKLYEQVVSSVYKKYNLTYMEFTVIMFLANNSMYDTASDIVKYRSLTKSHVSLSVKSLKQKGLLDEMFFEGDRKSKHLILTKQTSDIVQEGRVAQQNYIDIIHKGLTSKDKQLITQIVDKINKNINDNLEDLRRD